MILIRTAAALACLLAPPPAWSESATFESRLDALRLSVMRGVPAPPDQDDAYRRLLDGKSGAEADVGAVKAKFTQKDREYWEGHRLYSEAKAELNSIVETLIFHLIVGARLEEKFYASHFQEAARKIDVFCDYARDKAGAPARDALAERLPAKVLTSWFRSLKLRYEAADEEGRKEIRRELEALRLKDFFD